MALGKIFKTLGAAAVVAIAGGGVWLAMAPPLLLKVGDGYAAKIVCSNVFLAGRDADQVLAEDVQAPGHPLLKLLRVRVDREASTVTSRFMGLFAASTAVYRPGLGCTVVPDGDGAALVGAVATPTALVPAEKAPWPDGEQVEAGDPRIAVLISDAGLAGPGMRAIVVVKDGRIVGEAYGNGFDKDTPLLGWSMTKTVNAAILGRLMAEGKLGLDETNLFDVWKGDERAAISIRHLLAMEDGLQFNEDYGSVTDVTRMLYLERDMATFAASRPLETKPGTAFNYSSGTATLLTRLWMARVGTAQEALDYPRRALFAPLGMRSAVFETDAANTFVGSSYLYATARDWARFGQFLLQDGVWNGERLLPEGFVAAMGRPTGVSNGMYTEMQAWHAGPRQRGGEETGLPEDTFWLQGHDGQTVAIVPSAKLVVVRLGLTPGRLNYRPQHMLRAILDLRG